MPKWAVVSWTLTKKGSIIWKLRSWMSSFVCKSNQAHADSKAKMFMWVNFHSFLAEVNVRTPSVWQTHRTWQRNEMTLRWRQWSAEFVFFLFVLFFFACYATNQNVLLTGTLKSKYVLEVRQFNVYIDLKIWHLLCFFFLIFSLLSSIDLYGIFLSSLHSSCLL
jgi:hypothetical protein